MTEHHVHIYEHRHGHGGPGARDRRPAAGGRRAATRCALVAGAVVAALVGPVAIRHPGAFVRHVVSFPLGLTEVPSPAASPCRAASSPPPSPVARWWR
ncbi:hypothetical protein ACIBCM_21695 [Streptomyces sp. NPDC051018]|uniref:hypothetical protein n=1 Tax=Streptomyces sp. NPDC051018 TaxID=3365639 RepID=UPI00379AA0D7